MINVNKVTRYLEVVKTRLEMEDQKKNTGDIIFRLVVMNINTKG